MVTESRQLNEQEHCAILSEGLFSGILSESESLEIHSPPPPPKKKIVGCDWKLHGPKSRFAGLIFVLFFSLLVLCVIKNKKKRKENYLWSSRGTDANTLVCLSEAFQRCTQGCTRKWGQSWISFTKPSISSTRGRKSCYRWSGALFLLAVSQLLWNLYPHNLCFLQSLLHSPSRLPI